MGMDIEMGYRGTEEKEKMGIRIGGCNIHKDKGHLTNSTANM